MLKFSSYLVALLSLSILTACTGGDRGDTTVVVEPVVIDEAVTINHFLQFINQQAALAAGDYIVVAATATAGESGTYSLTIQFDDGSSEDISGEWVSSGGMNPADTNNPRHGFTLASPGGVKLTLDSTVDTFLYLLVNDNIFAEADDSPNGSNAYLAFENSQINALSYARAYYKAVDPYENRTTLADWKAINGFNEGSAQEITFRDVLDLGYGRNMYTRKRSDGGVAIYVDNYVVTFGPGDARFYGPLGLDAALAKDETYHIGSNALEFSPIDPDDPHSEKIVKIFSFGPPDENQIQPRVTEIDMDGRGEKYLPTVCLICHGGPPYPLNPDGTFPEETLRSAKLNSLDPRHFEFSDQAGSTLADLQPGMKEINQMIHGTYLETMDRDDANRGKWSAEHAIDLVAGAYGGDFSRDSYDSQYVPIGWQQNENRPEGVEQLYLGVIKKHCIVCHSLMGNNTAEGRKVQVNGESLSLANAINFSSYEKFISSKDQVIEDVYQLGEMPRALLNYNSFWSDPETTPTLLAKFLPGFNIYDENGKISEPRKPVAAPGANRTSTSPVNLNATDSFLADSYAWKLISTPEGAIASLSSPERVNARLEADTDGDYVIQLMVSNSANLSDTKEVTIRIDSMLDPSPPQLTFTKDIQLIIKPCSGCHVDDGFFKGIAVSFHENNPNLYADVRGRLNFESPEKSRLLLRPTQLRHGGGIRIDRSTEHGEITYQTLLNWTISGAPCGEDPMVCSDQRPEMVQP